MIEQQTRAIQLAAKAKTPFPGASAEYDNARRALKRSLGFGAT